MSIDTLSSESEHAAELTGSEPGAASDKVDALFSRLSGRASDAAIFCGAFALGIGGAACAIWQGANAPLALMVGYCAAASTAALYFSFKPALPAAVLVPERNAGPCGPTSAWKLVGVLTVSDASRLWCDIEPGAMATQETMAWGRAILDAIQRRELPIAEQSGVAATVLERERDNPHYMTRIKREALKAWADEHGHAPAFLR